MRPELLKRFKGCFLALGEMGDQYLNDQRFKPLKGHDKPLWEFKEHDHRLYCIRFVKGNSVEVILFCGWYKNTGTAKEESRFIQRAHLLHQEYLDERRRP